MATTKTKMAGVLCGLTIAGAGIFSGGMHAFSAQQVAAGTVQATPGAGQGQTGTPADSTLQAKVTLAKALEIAKGEAQGDVTGIELETDDSVLTYKVKVGTSKVYINAVDGSVIQVKANDDDESTLAQPKITLEKAVEIAQGQAQGDFHEIELDTKDGVLVWEVEIGNSDVSVNADDGSIVKVETDDSDHEDDQDHEDSDHNDDESNDD